MLSRALLAKFVIKASTISPFQFNQQRALHSRNKKALEFIAKGWNALKEVDRVIDYCELNDKRLIPLLRTAKENFELALEADNTNTHARYWLSRLHMKYHVPGANKAVGAALLVEAAEMGDPDAQYALGCHLRVDNDYVQSDQQAFYYLEKAVDQLHPGALYLLGAVYLTGDCVKKDIASALWCFHRASEKGRKIYNIKESIKRTALLVMCYSALVAQRGGLLTIEQLLQAFSFMVTVTSILMGFEYTVPISPQFNEQLCPWGVVQKSMYALIKILLGN